MLLVDSAQSRRFAAQQIANGRLVAFRTDTFYGLGANPFDRDALRMVKQLKGTDAGKPLLVIISDASEAERFVAECSRSFEILRARHWPGPLTIVVPARPQIPEELTANTGTIGLRLPDDKRVRSFVRACGGALTATSANPSGKPPARTAAEAANYFPASDLLVIDSGQSRSDKPSTVVDVTGPAARLVREGIITRQELQQTLRVMSDEQGSPMSDVRCPKSEP